MLVILKEAFTENVIIKVLHLFILSYVHRLIHVETYTKSRQNLIMKGEIFHGCSMFSLLNFQYFFSNKQTI